MNNLVEVDVRLAWSPMEMTLLLSATSALSYIFSASYRKITRFADGVCVNVLSR